MTVKKALDILVAEGLIYKRRGAGTSLWTCQSKNGKDVDGYSNDGDNSLLSRQKIKSRVIDFTVVKGHLKSQKIKN